MRARLPSRVRALVAAAAFVLGAAAVARAADAADAPGTGPAAAPAPAEDPAAAIVARLRALGRRPERPDVPVEGVLWTRWGLEAFDRAWAGDLGAMVEAWRGTAAGVFPEVGPVEGSAPHRRARVSVRVGRASYAVLVVEADGWQVVRADRVPERGRTAVGPFALRAAAEKVMEAVDTRDPEGFARRSAERKDGALARVEPKAVEAMLGELHERYGARPRVLLFEEALPGATRAVVSVVVDRAEVLDLELEKDAEGLWRLVGLSEGDPELLDAVPPAPTRPADEPATPAAPSAPK